MTVKDLAYTVQQHLESATGERFKRSHTYQLFAAAFGFNSYAGLCADAVLSNSKLADKHAQYDFGHVNARSLAMGYSAKQTIAIANVIETLLVEQEVVIISFRELIARLHFKSGYGEWPDQWDESEPDEWHYDYDPEFGGFCSLAMTSSLFLSSLSSAASKGNADAHYALALLHAPVVREFDDWGEPATGSEYWYQQSMSGRLLTDYEQQFADDYSASTQGLKQETKLGRPVPADHAVSVRHLREAANLGHSVALLALAELFNESAFFDQLEWPENINPLRVAEVAERAGRFDEARSWLTQAATSGCVGAMQQLIEKDKYDDLSQCWTWVYLAQLLGTDFTWVKTEAINGDGSAYDDYVGGPIYVLESGGLDLAPISERKQAESRSRAAELFKNLSNI